MKKLLLLLMFAFESCNLLAQDCNLCGTWIGVFRVFLDGDNTTKRLYIDIKKTYRDKYVVRVKEVYTYNDQSSKTYYWHECMDVNANKNVITWKSFSHQIDDNEDGGYEKYYYVCTARVDNGILYFKQMVEGFYYGRNGEIIGEYNQPAYPTKELYKDEDNW